MAIDRRQFLAGGGVAVAAAGVPAVRAEAQAAEPPKLSRGANWEEVRRQFVLAPDIIDMSAMLIASHPAPVRAAIETYRQALDADPVRYLNTHNGRLQTAARNAAGDYLGVPGSAVALTDSTTMGVGLVYNALRLKPEQEILLAEENYYVTDEAVRLAALRSGASVRRVRLHEDSAAASEDEIVTRLAGAIGGRTRVIALTWVLSSTGLKLPLPAIAEAVREANRGRDEDDRVLIAVDGVHGFGNQDLSFADLGCDFFMAGCHKWLFGPRGTGIAVARPEAWQALDPIIPSFIDDAAWNSWLGDEGQARRTTRASSMTPGGFKAFEHQWAVSEAFAMHRAIGRDRIAGRTAELASRLKQGLSQIDGVALRTPMAESLSAGIVSFDVAGRSPFEVVRRLEEKGVIASVAPYARPHVRLTPSIRNIEEEVDRAVEAVAADVV